MFLTSHGSYVKINRVIFNYDKIETLVMISIQEYLNIKDIKKNQVKVPIKAPDKRPKENCKVEEIIDWLNKFGQPNMFKTNEWHKYDLEPGEVGYKIFENKFHGYKYVVLYSKPTKYVTQTIDAYPSANRSYISWGYTRKDVQLSFDEAIKLMEEVMLDPEKYIEIKK